MQESEAVVQEICRLALAAKEAGRKLATAPTATKNAVLRRAARDLRARIAEIVSVNAEEVAAAAERALSEALRDRLRLDGGRLEAIARSVEAIADLLDPVGSVEALVRRPNGLLVGRMRVPLGLVAIVYESRSSMTADAAARCLKSGDACVLRGGSEAMRTNEAIAEAFEVALEAEGLPRAAATLLRSADREAVRVLARASGIVDLLIPRGGEGLIRAIAEIVTVPVMQHAKGVCDIDGALAHVARHGSRHTEAIVTCSYDKAQRWLREVDASSVLVNASTRFNDRGELGLGAELGIPTTKLHAYGPMGLEELCARKWIAYGDGQVRS